ncbi:MAG TPA: circadian clock protein KaiC [Burkholderiales bacterium]|nr:circadian clock protein KaiC [Burkholderiales bacterium]
MATKQRTKRNPRNTQSPPGPKLAKSPTGIAGLDEITDGGLPTGRPTLVCGSAGSGKTMLGMEFLVRGATQFKENGVMMMFEENDRDISENTRSLGFDVDRLVKQKKLAVDYVYLERSEIEETGEYDLEGLFIRLTHAIDSVGAKRVVIDTLEALFSAFKDETVLRAELRRLFRWLKDRGMTAVITGERGERSLTRYGLEEYVADCVILLDHRVIDEISTRRLRVVKYRGTTHGTNEYPFMIGSRGLSVLPITSLTLNHQVSMQRVSSGLPGLDGMLGAKGYYRGSSVLVSGPPGTGKSSFAALFANAACARGERVLFFAYEESVSQLVRNMRSIGVDLQQWLDRGLLHIHASRPTLYGLEQHLMQMHDLVLELKPAVVLVDPISNLSFDHDAIGFKPTLMRLIDFLKQQRITALFTNLTEDGTVALAAGNTGVSSLMDTWLLVSNLQGNAERTRALQVLKSRGMSHSNQVREFVITGRGIELIDVFRTGSLTLTGSARSQEQGRLASAAGAGAPPRAARRPAAARRGKA